jgi:glycosyltransferase involved in cell wall biosynthesis
LKKNRTKVLINGYFLCRKITGIERYAHEITLRLDGISLPGEISIIVPSDSKNIPPYKNLNVIRYKKKIPHILWQFFSLQSFLLVHRDYTILDFGNTCLPLTPGIVFLHDIYCEFFPEDFTGFRDKVVRLYNRRQYRLIAKKAKQIVTVSQFSKNQIAETYHINPERVKVIYSSWDHFRTVKPDYSVFDDFPALSKPFYFSLGSLSKRKNIKWIIEYAAKNPGAFFAVSGTSLPTARTRDLDGAQGDILLLGYLDDGKVKALMERCKAFILPSYYEGFGLTPLEALSCGAKIIVADAASLPEIYGNTAHYIDPFNTDIDLDALLAEPVESPDAILKKYSYDTSAAQVYEIIGGPGGLNPSGGARGGAPQKD